MLIIKKVAAIQQLTLSSRLAGTEFGGDSTKGDKSESMIIVLKQNQFCLDRF